MENLTELNNKINNILSKEELQTAILMSIEKSSTIEELLILN